MMFKTVAFFIAFTVLFPSQVLAQINLEKGKVVYFFKNECKDINGSMQKYDKLFEYQAQSQAKAQVS